MSQEARQFVGKTKVIETKYGSIIKIAFGPNDFEVMANSRNDKGWVNLEMKDKRDGGKYLQIQGDAQPPKEAVNTKEDYPF
jgi:hypothetical protein